jgi:subtilase family serine protease
MRAILVTGGASALVVGMVGAASAAPAASSGAGPARAAIAGTHPSWATAKAKVSSAPVPQSVNAYVYLAGQDPAGLAAYAREVSTPGSALYGHYLSASATMARFGPTSSQVSAVESWLAGSGLKVTGVADEIGGYVEVSGTAAEAAKAFGVSFGMYRGPKGAAYRAPEQSATIPASVASDVLTVAGLDTAPHLAKPQETLPPPPQNYWVAQPCGQYYDQKYATSEPKAYGKTAPWNVCGYTPKQIRGAYGVAASGMTGKGVTVAVVDAYASPTMQSDANQYAEVTGDKPFRSGQYTQDLLGGKNHWTQTAACGANGWYGEESLDVESVHGEAPDANVVYVGAVSCSDVDLGNALATIVNKHLADIVTDSWGETADSSSISYDQIFEAGAAEGIGFFFSSGDSGYEDPAYEDGGSNKIQVDYPTSSPWVTSVGGTSLAIGKTNNYEFETSWGTVLDPLSSSGSSWSFTPPGTTANERAYYDGSGGGGVSTTYTQPWYQSRVVPASLAKSLPGGTTSTVPMRVVPDVSALADPSTGILVGQTLYQQDGKTLKFSLSRIGGTSLASPTFAGIEADAQQAAGHPLGFANPVIYALDSVSGSHVFHDVTDHPFGPSYLAQVRNNYTNPYTATGPLVTWLRTLGIDGVGASALPAVTGYDDSTGVGSPSSYIEAFGHQ